MLSTQGYTPWHHASHGSHWLQPRGAWKYKTHNVRGSLQEVTFGWRLGLPMGQTGYHAGGNEFTMSSFAEDHMSKEDLGVGATTQEWTDLQNLGRELMRWDNLPIDSLGNWSQVPPRAPEKKDPRPRSRGRKNRRKGISCFLGSTRVRMATTNWRSPQYKRMDKLVKGDKIWTRRQRRDCREPNQGQVSIVECVMAFACPLEGQLMVEVDGNFLTPDHHVAKGRGKWSTAGALAQLDTDSTTQLTHMVYNIKLQSGGQIEIGNKVYAATLGARFDTVEVGQDHNYSADTTRYLQDLPEYSSGHIHWAWGTASVDQHGMPRPKRTQAFPSEIGSSTLLDPEILETILMRQYADQGWIDILSMIRRVHSTWNIVVRSIYPEFDTHPSRELIQNDGKAWRATFSRDQDNAQATIRHLREDTTPDPWPAISNILNIIQTYPGSLNILGEAMHALYKQTPPWSSGNEVLRWYLLGADTLATTLYSTLSRHTLRPTPYSAQDLPSQIWEHLAATPRATKVRVLGEWILNTLEKFKHCCPSAILILLNSLRILTAGRAPCKKEKQDWVYTRQIASILSMNLSGMISEDLTKLDKRGLDAILNFIQTHLIAQGCRWMRKRAYAGWKSVQDTFTIYLYDIITDLLRIQSRPDTLHLTGMLQVIADSIVDNTQSEECTVKGLNILPRLKLGSQHSPLDGVILKVLQSRWNGNILTSTIWEQSHRQRSALHAAGGDYGPDETAGILTLISDVLHAYCFHDSPSHVCRLSGPQKSDRDSFSRTGCHWIRDLATLDMSNLNRIGLLCTKPLLRILTHMRDEPITVGHYIHTLCLLSSPRETGDRIRDLAGFDTIMALLPLQYQDKRGDATPQNTINLHNKNLRFTLCTLRNLTGPNGNHPHGPRLGTGANLLRVLDTLQVWMGDETSKGLTLQVLLNLSGISDLKRDLTYQNLTTPQYSNSDTYPTRKEVRSDQTGTTGNPLAFLHRLETDTHKIERTIRSLQHLPSQHHTTQMLGMTVLGGLTPEGFSLGEGHWRTENSSGAILSRGHSLIRSQTW